MHPYVHDKDETIRIAAKRNDIMRGNGMGTKHAMGIALHTYPSSVVLGVAESDEGCVFGLGTPEGKDMPPVPGGLYVAVGRNDAEWPRSCWRARRSTVFPDRSQTY